MAKAALDIERDNLELRFPHREVWWVPELTLGNGRAFSWHSRIRGALNADVHAGTPAGLAAAIEQADGAGR